MRALAFILAFAVCPLASAQSVEPKYPGPACAIADSDCIMRALLWHSDQLDIARAREAHLLQAFSLQQQQIEEMQKQLDKRSEPPSRLRWLFIGAAGMLVVGGVIALEAHR